MVTTLAKQRQKLSKYKLWRARFIILSLRKTIEKLAVRLAFFMALILSDVVNRQNMK